MRHEVIECSHCSVHRAKEHRATSFDETEAVRPLNPMLCVDRNGVIGIVVLEQWSADPVPPDTDREF